MGVKVVTVMRWYAQDEVNQDSEQNEVDGMKKGADSTGKVMHMWKIIKISKRSGKINKCSIWHYILFRQNLVPLSTELTG